MKSDGLKKKAKAKLVCVIGELWIKIIIEG